MSVMMVSGAAAARPSLWVHSEHATVAATAACRCNRARKAAWTVGFAAARGRNWTRSQLSRRVPSSERAAGCGIFGGQVIG